MVCSDSIVLIGISVFISNTLVSGGVINPSSELASISFLLLGMKLPLLSIALPSCMLNSCLALIAILPPFPLSDQAVISFPFPILGKARINLALIFKLPPSALLKARAEIKLLLRNIKSSVS